MGSLSRRKPPKFSHGPAHAPTGVQRRARVHAGFHLGGGAPETAPPCQILLNALRGKNIVTVSNESGIESCDDIC